MIDDQRQIVLYARELLPQIYACLRQLNGTGRTDKKFDTEFRFKIRNVPGDGLLRNKTALSRLAEVQAAGYFQKIDDTFIQHMDFLSRLFYFIIA